ncbi:MAG: ABC transporter ATP-binding protein [Bryobacteraceae bacterium]|nr:ABC transporter ATP-binding protein [Bryobacteraceae bacterium]
MEEISIRADGLTKRYRSGPAELVVFEDLTFEVPVGERLALIGESGAGKSTLLHLLGGLDRPSSGRVLLGDDDLFTLSDSDLAYLRNRRIGFVWQQNSLLPEFTALENVMMPLLVRGIPAAEAEGPAMTRLEEVGLKNRASHRAGELSGGEQQRVALARALAGRPQLLLADEPTGNLDYKTGEMVIALLRDLHAAHKLTSIYVTHNSEFARRCDRILKLDKGTLIAAA